MDSKAVGKLIRTEVWPLLRAHEFSIFEARTAFRYQAPFVHVVNFQSFNSHVANGVGCTTFSFRLNLGVYVQGSAREEAIKTDAEGRLLPREYECSFRLPLRKRTPVDGFERDDIFYIDETGRTTTACFEEARYLLSEVAPGWFRNSSDLDKLISWLSSPAASAPVPLELFPNPGSYVRHDLLATLLLWQHQQSPTAQTSDAALREIDNLIGALFDLPAMTATPQQRESEMSRVRALWHRLGPIEPPAIQESPVTERRAIAADAIQVVTVKPADRAEGPFRVGLGLFWPELRDQERPKPQLSDCHLSTWLWAERSESAASAGAPWFGVFADPEAAILKLRETDRELFQQFPMMRGQGSRSSMRRMLLLAALAARLQRIDEARKYLDLAERAIEERGSEQMKPRQRQWAQTVRDRLLAAERRT